MGIDPMPAIPNIDDFEASLQSTHAPLDELMFFNHVLSPEDITRLWVDSRVWEKPDLFVIRTKGKTRITVERWLPAKRKQRRKS
jgi:hypothetical protein